MHRKYSEVVTRWLKNDPGFVAALDKACREIINRNAVCQKSAAKSSELLVRYCDGLLRKGNKNPEAQELEEQLKNVVRARANLRPVVRMGCLACSSVTRRWGCRRRDWRGRAR